MEPGLPLRLTSPLSPTIQTLKELVRSPTEYVSQGALLPAPLPLQSITTKYPNTKKEPQGSFFFALLFSEPPLARRGGELQ